MKTAPLTLRNLPNLLTDCVLVGHAKRADVVFTSRQWFAMCTHMMNENPANLFLMPYQDENGNAMFRKAFRADAYKRIQWAWDTITGNAKRPASIGFYPTNSQRESRWAAMDFDIHDDDQMRPRDFAFKAFGIFCQQPQLYVVLTTSAGDPQHSGWHLFVFTAEFFQCEDWTRLLRQVADYIGALVKPGICEIFPDGSRGIGHAIRAPGTWNPKNGECGLILHQTFTKLLPALLPSITLKRDICSLYTRCNTGEADRISPSSKLFRGERGQWAIQFAITEPSTRHQRLLKLVGSVFFQAGRPVVRKNAELQYTEANPRPVASLAEHLTEFDQMWAGMERQWLARLSPIERVKFDILTTDSDRDGFRILRNWAQTESPDFKVHCQSLANRLGMSLNTACNIRNRFCSLRILRKTAEYIPNKLAARYRWIAADESTGRALHDGIGTANPGDLKRPGITHQESPMG